MERRSTQRLPEQESRALLTELTALPDATEMAVHQNWKQNDMLPLLNDFYSFFSVCVGGMKEKLR